MKRLLFFILLGVFVTISFLHVVDASNFKTLYSAASENVHGVKEITYKQFVQMRSSGEPYVLLDVLPSDSFNDGHIPHALNFPVSDMTPETVAERLSLDAEIIVYCGSFECSASTQAAQLLQSLGYTVLDYKGGLKEWQAEGNTLTK